MRQRCRQNPAYVTRGIKVCEEWDASFEAFLRDIGPAPSPKHTLDRWPNTTGHYEPGNVRWATMLEQRHNRRPDSKTGRPWLGKRRPALSGSGNPSAKLTIEQVEVIKRSRSSGVRVGELARTYGVSRQTITNITSGRSWGQDGNA